MLEKKKLGKSLALLLGLSLAIGPVVSAASKIYTEKIEAIYGGIKFNYEGQDVTQKVEEKYGTPGFVVKSQDRSYIPVRAAAEVFGLDVDYDKETMTALIKDPKVQDLAAKDQEIKKLTGKVDQLEKELAKLKEGTVTEETLTALEKRLNKDYSSFHGVDFSFKLKEKSNYIDINIQTDFANTGERMKWVNMNYSRKKEFIDGVSDLVAIQYPKVNLEGVVFDKKANKNLLDFSRAAGKNTTTIRYNDVGYGRDIEKFVEDEFYYNHIGDARVDMYREDTRKVYLEVSFTDDYKREWDKLSRVDIERMLDKVANELDYDTVSKNLDKEIGVYMGSKHLGSYVRYYDEQRGIYDYSR